MSLNRNRKYTYKEREKLPDSAFLLPKYRKLPFKQVQGGKLKISLSHVRNALARANQVQDVPRKEVQAAVRRARMILSSRGGYKHADPTPIHYRMAANGSGLSIAQAQDLSDHLIAQGISPEDVEILPLTKSATSKLCVMYWDGFEWAEIWSAQDIGDMMRNFARNWGRKSTKTKTGISRTEALRLLDEVRDTFGGQVDYADLVTFEGGKGYGVYVRWADGWSDTFTSPSDVPEYFPNRRRRLARNLRAPQRAPSGLSHREAQALADEVDAAFGDDVDYRVVTGLAGGRGYGVTIFWLDGSKDTIFSEDELYAPAKAKPVATPARKGRAGVSQAAAKQLAEEIRADWPEASSVRVAKAPGGGHMVEIEWRDGGYDTATSVNDLMFLPNRRGMRPNFFGRKAPVDSAAEARSSMRSSREWRDFRNGVRSDYLMRGAKVPPPEVLDSMADERYAEYHSQRRSRAASGLARNGSDFKDLILMGLVEGFWAGTEAEGDAPGEVMQFAKKFYTAVTKINGFSLSKFFGQMRDTSDPEQFGYYIAMQAVRSGVSWWDDHDGPRGIKLRLPDTEVHAEYDPREEELDLFFSMDPDRLNFEAWGG